MNVRAIRYTVGKRGAKVVREVVDPERRHPLGGRSGEPPVVFLVSMSAVDSLVALACLVDRLVKAKEVELARYLLRVEGTPLVRATYTSPGRLAHSLWSFLAVAEKAGESKVYYVAVPADLFEPQWRVAHAELEPPAPTPLSSPVTPGPVATTAPVKPFDPHPGFLPAPEFGGTSPGAIWVRLKIAEYARTLGPVLISGPPGSGRTLVAELVHHSSPRADRQFLQCRCRGVPPELQQRQLFGVPSGKVTVPGALGFANGGTLVIQDFEWLPLALQTKLVEACLGPNATVDVRLVFISSLDLSQLVARGRVDHALAGASNGAEIRIPSLSERPEDSRVIAIHMWRWITVNGPPLPTKILDDIPTHIFANEADGLYDVLVRLFVRSTDGRYTRAGLLAAIHESRTARATYASPAGELFGVELDPTPQYEAQLEKLVNAVRDLWIAIRPIRQGHHSTPRQIVAAIPDINAKLEKLDQLCRWPFRFVDAVLYHKVLDFKGDIMALRDLGEAEPGEIGTRWEVALKVPEEEKYHRLNAALFDARDRLRGDGPDRQ